MTISSLAGVNRYVGSQILPNAENTRALTPVRYTLVVQNKVIRPRDGMISVVVAPFVFRR